MDTTEQRTKPAIDLRLPGAPSARTQDARLRRRSRGATVLSTIGASLVLALAMPAPAAGENSLVNPGFDSDLSGWVNFSGHPTEWSPLDALGDPASGSARITNNVSPGNGGTLLVMRQCFVVVPGQSITFGGDLYVPDPSPESTTASIFLWMHALPGCNGQTTQSANLDLFETGVWRQRSATVTAGPTIVSAAVYLGVSKFTGITADTNAHFDNVVLELSIIFADGFE